MARHFIHVFTSILLTFFAHTVCYVNFNNITNVLDAYVLTCGFKLCDNSLSSYFEINTTLKVNGSVCLECQCDIGCFFRKDCCPDIIFNGPNITCMSPDVLVPMPSFDRKFNMIYSCPLKASKEKQRRCKETNGTVALLQNPPTTYGAVTFRNGFCADCNQVDANDDWKLEFNCLRFVDFNFLSSLDEIIETAEDAKCNITYDPPNPSVTECTEDENYGDDNEITTCNVTGTWEDFESDIQLACEKANGKVQNFKNVLCFICNPPTKFEDFINTCNYTGLANINEDANKLCKDLPETKSTYPFKNAFCYLCNIPKTYLPFLDIQHAGILWSKTKIVVETQSINLAVVLNNYLNITETQTECLPERSIEIYDDERKVNISALVQYYEKRQIFTSDEACPNSHGTCSCDPVCIFTFKQCCMELLLTYNTTCVSSFVASTHCRYQSKVTELCHSPFDDSLYNALPINLHGITYRNVFCSICNAPRLDRSLFSQQNVPWNIEIHCPTELTVDFFVYMSDLFRYAHAIGCQITYTRKKNEKLCPNSNSYLQDQCYWIWGSDYIYNEDVDWACSRMENPLLPGYLLFKNVFCFLCNPPIPTTTPVMTFPPPTTSLTTHPNTHTRSPSTTTSTTTAPPRTTSCLDCDDPFENVQTFRSIFSIKSYRYSLPSDKDDKIKTCSNTELYDQIKDQCQPLTCYPGKALTNQTCEPLLKTTSNLGYKLRIKVVAQVDKYNSTVLDFLKETKTWFSEYLVSTIDIPFIKINAFDSVSTHPCQYHLTKQTEELTIYSFINIFIQESVDRLKTEELLILLHEREFNVTHENGMIVFKFSTDQSYNTLKIKDTVDHRFACVYSFNPQLEYSPLATYRSVQVSPLLTCTQIELKEDTYTIDWPKQIVNIRSYSFSLSFGEYLVSKNKIRLCSSTFKTRAKLPSKRSTLTWTLNMIMDIVSVISLVFLLLTFIIYASFRSLRTLPGKNNMCLVFALFWTMLLFTFGFKLKDNDAICKSVGILLHYFWLSSFFCLNVCTFHMFKTFKSITLPSSTKSSETKIFVKYIIYSFGLPLVIVGLNVGITTGVTDERSFGYGDIMCFLTFVYAVWTTFLVPISLVCFSNIIFFSVTFYKILTIPKVQNDSKIKQNKVNASVYFKLFSLTGIVWILQLIEAFLPVYIFTFIISIVNSLQGLFIFLSFACNKRVYNLIITKLCFCGTCDEHVSTDTTTVKSSSLPKENDNIRQERPDH